MSSSDNKKLEVANILASFPNTPRCFNAPSTNSNQDEPKIMIIDLDEPSMSQNSVDMKRQPEKRKNEDLLTGYEMAKRSKDEIFYCSSIFDQFNYAGEGKKQYNLHKPHTIVSDSDHSALQNTNMDLECTTKKIPLYKNSVEEMDTFNIAPVPTTSRAYYENQQLMGFPLPPPASKSQINQLEPSIYDNVVRPAYSSTSTPQNSSQRIFDSYPTRFNNSPVNRLNTASQMNRFLGQPLITSRSPVIMQSQSRAFQVVEIQRDPRLNRNQSYQRRLPTIDEELPPLVPIRKDVSSVLQTPKPPSRRSNWRQIPGLFPIAEENPGDLDFREMPVLSRVLPPIQEYNGEDPPILSPILKDNPFSFECRKPELAVVLPFSRSSTAVECTVQPSRRIFPNIEAMPSLTPIRRSEPPRDQFLKIRQPYEENREYQNRVFMVDDVEQDNPVLTRAEMQIKMELEPLMGPMSNAQFKKFLTEQERAIERKTSEYEVSTTTDDVVFLDNMHEDISLDDIHTPSTPSSPAVSACSDSQGNDMLEVLIDFDPNEDKRPNNPR